MKDIRICFVGDSFVNGTGDPEKLGWAGRLCAASEDASRQITCYNLGVRRDTSCDILGRWESECGARLKEVDDARVVFSFGVNDCMEENGILRVNPELSIDNAQQILNPAARRYQTLMVGPPPIDDDAINTRVRELDQKLHALCTSQGVPYLSVFDALRGLPLWQEQVASNDGAHPKAEGYAHLAKLVRLWKGWWFHPGADD